MKTFALIVTALWASAGWAGVDINESREVDSNALIRVSNVKGSISVSGWSRNEVRITGELGRGSEKLDIRGDGQHLEIEVKLPRNARNIEESELELMVPEGASLELEGVSADIDVKDVGGERVYVNTVSGEADVSTTAREVEVRTVSGDAQLESDSLRTTLNTVSGDLTASGPVGELDITTVSGDVELRASDLSRARFETVSGDLELDVSLAKNARIQVESLSGDLDLFLPEDHTASCEAQSFSGNIRSDFGQVTNEKYGPKKSLDYQVGDGDGRIRIESFSGDVRIRARD